MSNDPQNSPGFLSGSAQDKESRSYIPWVLAGSVVVIGLVLLFIFGGKKAAPYNPGGADLAAADPYAASLPITGLQMSESSNFAGGKVTYVDGHLANTGNRTITGITVQVAFRDFGNQLAQKETLPLTLIRTREPYVDTQPVSANPIQPGDQRDFRIVLDQVTGEWNGQYPEVRIIQIVSK